MSGFRQKRNLRKWKTLMTAVDLIEGFEEALKVRDAFECCEDLEGCDLERDLLLDDDLDLISRLAGGRVDFGFVSVISMLNFFWRTGLWDVKAPSAEKAETGKRFSWPSTLVESALTGLSCANPPCSNNPGSNTDS